MSETVMVDSNPLEFVFSKPDLDRLAQEDNPFFEGKVDYVVASLLTDEFHRDFQYALAHWLRLARDKGCGEYFIREMKCRLRDRASFWQIVGELMAGFFL